jgi:hypothetical protein
MPKLILKRIPNYLSKLRKFNVSINEKVIDQIANGETRTYELQQGQNTILAYMKEGKSNTLILNVADNSDVKLNIRISKFDITATLISFLMIPFLAIYLGANFYLNYKYYLIFSVFYILYLIIRKLLNLNSLVISKE